MRNLKENERNNIQEGEREGIKKTVAQGIDLGCRGSREGQTQEEHP